MSFFKELITKPFEIAASLASEGADIIVEIGDGISEIPNSISKGWDEGLTNTPKCDVPEASENPTTPAQ